MSYIVYISPEAISDIHASSSWYNNQKIKLGDRFKIQVKKQITSISEFPKIFSVKYKTIRCAPVPKFPFLIHYHLNENSKTVDILAVFHTSRNPKTWNNRV